MKPVISIVFPKNTQVQFATFNPPSPSFFTNASSIFDRDGDVETGKVVLCKTIKNNQWYGHRVDFILQRIDNDWQPYVVEYDISKPSPLPPNIDKSEYLQKKNKD